MNHDMVITRKSFDISEHFSFLANVYEIGGILAHLSDDLRILNRYFSLSLSLSLSFSLVNNSDC